MTWPQATDYNAAVQNPQVCFGDDDLRQGRVVGGLFGLPRPHSGNFGDVYQIQGADNQNWAVKCFTRPAVGLRPRYQAISDHLRQAQRAFMVEFRYLDEGIRIRGQWYPIVKMRWVEGFRLNEFVRHHLDKPALLDRLAQMWMRLARELRDAQMAHGDLQHGNVLLAPGSKSSSLALKLIDYDGMYVPALADTPSGEVGHPHYQHPQRLREGTYDGEVDRFSHLLIYAALRCLAAGGAELWQRYDNQENLLFREDDFRRPRDSRLLRELWHLKDRDARDLVGHLLLAGQGPLGAVPILDELVEERVVRPLTGSEEAKVNALLGQASATMRMWRIAVPTQIVPASVALLEAPAEEAAVPAATETMPSRPAPPPLPRRMTPPPPLSRSTSDEMTLEEPGSAVPEPPSEFGTLIGPLAALLSRPAWLTTLGAIALIGFLLVNVLVWSFAKQPESAPPAAPPRLLAIPEVSLRGGYKQQVPLFITRNDCAEPLTIHVEGLPAEMKPPVLELSPDQDSVTLPLLAPLDMDLSPRDVLVSLWRDGRRIDEQRFQLSVRKVARAVLRPSEPIRCKPGATVDFTGQVDRRGCDEPLTLRFLDLPRSIRQESLPGLADVPPRVRLTVAADAKPQGPVVVSLELRIGDLIADTRTLSFSVEKSTPGVRLRKETAAEALSVKAGGQGELPVAVERGDYKGPLEVRLEGLPPHVSATALLIPPTSSAATVIVETTAEAEPGRRTVKLIVLAEGQPTDAAEITLTVEQPAAAAKTERVTFPTVDHLQLAGTLYPGSKGKKGACVLMLHDLGKHRATPGWRRLAEALQAQGHTVLTFDFRGHGESTSATRDFWTNPVNRHLPAYDNDKLPLQQSDKIDAAGLSGAYVPWLIHDIAAARTFLDLRHDDPDGPVNTFNMVLLGAGQASALGSLWLASEGVRFNADGKGADVELKPPEKLSFLQVIWLGMETKLKGQTFPVENWVRQAHRNPVVPMVFVYGAKDAESARLLGPLVAQDLGSAAVIPEARLAGQQLLDEDPAAARHLHVYLAGSLNALRFEKWVPRRIKRLRSYWGFPTDTKKLNFFLAKHAGEELTQPVPLERFGIHLEGLARRKPVVPGFTDK
jgi:hypothetical protein